MILHNIRESEGWGFCLFIKKQITWLKGTGKKKKNQLEILSYKSGNMQINKDE